MEKNLKISEETHTKLESLGNKSETYDEIISRLCDFWTRYKDVIDQQK